VGAGKLFQNAARQDVAQQAPRDGLTAFLKKLAGDRALEAIFE